MSNQVKNSSSGISFLSLLAIVFIVLKLTNVIDWSWWWVLLPLWGCFAAITFFVLIGFVVYYIIK